MLETAPVAAGVWGPLAAVKLNICTATKDPLILILSGFDMAGHLHVIVANSKLDATKCIIHLATVGCDTAP